MNQMPQQHQGFQFSKTIGQWKFKIKIRLSILLKTEFSISTLQEKQ
jgi:hypothetical protein